MSTENSLSDSFKTPLEMFYHWESVNPEKVWLRQPGDDGWKDYTWSQVGKECRAVAAALIDMGLNSGDKVGIYANNCAHWIMADVAIMMAGMTSVPIYPSMPTDKIQYVAEHSEMKALFSDFAALSCDNVRAALPGISLISLVDDDSVQADAVWQTIVQDQPPLSGNPLRDKDDLWTIAYTSGTTGMPKGVMHSFDTLPRSSFELMKVAGSDENARFFSYLPLAHVAERTVIELQSLYAGASIGFNRSKETFTEGLKEIRPTFFFAVPRIWVNMKAGIIKQLGSEAWGQLMVDPDKSRELGKQVLTAMGLDAVTHGFSGAAPIATADIDAWQALGMPLYEAYGQSEAMSITANRRGHCRVGTVGKVFADTTELKISDKGEILVRSPANMVGYYRAPDKTAETIVDGWIHTGDKGAFDDDGYLRITGRVKEIFKTAKGKYVAPAPIEGHFGDIAYIDQLCLVGSGLPKTILLVVLAPSANTLDQQELSESLAAKMEEVNSKLEVHERMGNIILCQEPWTIENGLLTHTLKILRDDVEANHSKAIQKCATGEVSHCVVWEADC